LTQEEIPDEATRREDVEGIEGLSISLTSPIVVAGESSVATFTVVFSSFKQALAYKGRSVRCPL